MQHALADLIVEKDLRYITVQELSDKADIHRATFYSHYHDVYDLYDQIENSVLFELDEIIANDSTHNVEGVFQSFIDYIYDNGNLFNMFIGENGNINFQNKVYLLLEKKYYEIWMQGKRSAAVSSEIRLLIMYHIEGCIAIISSWASEGYSRPKEEIISIIRKVDEHFNVIAK